MIASSSLNLITAITGFLGVVMLARSEKLIPWGLRMPKKSRHPWKKKGGVNNSSNQSTSNVEEWWGSKLKDFGWLLLICSFAIQIYVALNQ